MRILSVEDDKQLSTVLQKALADAGYAVDVANDGQEGYFMATSEPYDLIILDIRLPMMDGLTILKNLREKEITTPILMLTGKDLEDDKVAGLNLGADDYLTKPFSLKELRARVQALLRRSMKEPMPVLKIADLELDPRTHVVTRAGEPVDLSPKEFAILEYLLAHKDDVVSRTELLEHVWDYNYDGISNVVDVFMSYLRKKIDADRKDKLIHTVHGVGFKITEATA